MSQPAIIARQITHRYGHTVALDDVSIEIRSGEMTGLLGPNGSGKTTLFRLLSTLIPLEDPLARPNGVRPREVHEPREKSERGSITIDGLDLATQASEIRHRIGVTFQSPALDVRLTALENLHCHAAIYGIPRIQRDDRIRQLAGLFRLSDRLHDITGKLSGGLKRRVELMKGMLHQPEILLLDEPSSGLDVRSRRELFDTLESLRRDLGTTVVIATHLMEEASRCDRLILLDAGRVVAAGTPPELIASMPSDVLSVRCRDVAESGPVIAKLLGADGCTIGNEISFRLNGAADRIQPLLSQFGDDIIAIQVSRPSLEDAFLKLTGHSLHAEGEVVA